MKILIVSSFLPFPLHSGGHVRLYNLIKELSKKHKITLVAEKRYFQTEKDVEAVKKYCEEVYTVLRKKQWSFENILRSGVSSYPFLLIGHENPQMKKLLVEILRDKHFDVIHVETFYVYVNVPKTYLPVVLVEHNIEYLVYKRFLETANFFVKPFLWFDIKKIKRWEEKFWKKATKVVAVSEAEEKYIKLPDVALVPNGVDIKIFKYQSPVLKLKKREKRILFIGDFKWIQNRKAVEWILKEIWPEISSKFNPTAVGQNSKLILWIVGKHIPESLKFMGGEDVTFDENAPDETWKIYQKAFALLAPIKVGGGTSYKILESMASGLPVVTTPLGIEGIKKAPVKEALIGNDASELAEQVLLLTRSENLYKELTEKARKLIEEKYSWENIAEKLEKVYKESLT